ncbi:MAG: tRNA pseudouridine(55) synthase TruB [Acidobacteriota bacterium]
MRDGLLIIDKHSGCTSHDVVASTRRIVRQKKIGHCGTLDPSATGLLLLTLGKATRLTRFLIKAPKVYDGTARLGIATDTYDLAGQVLAEQPVDGVTQERIAEVMDGFVGEYLQTPPPYSAKKIKGEKFYELARRGEAVPAQASPVTVYEFSPTTAWAPDADLGFRLGCASGTYARSLVHDLGQQLECGATLASLRRTKIGPFDLTDAIGLDTLRERTEADEDLGAAWVPFDEIPLPFGEITADAQQERRIQHGQTVLVRDLEGREGDWVKVLSQRQELIAVGAIVERIGTGSVGVVQPKVVFQ